MKKLLRATIAALIIFLFAFPAGIALADQANPDSTPTATTYVFRNLIESGDQLYVVYANIPYAATPTELESDAFIWRLIDTDGTSVLGQTTGYPFNDSGYGYNVYSFYFSSAEAPTWDQAYTVRLTGNPAIFDTPPTYDYTLDSGDFSSAASDTPTQRTELGNRIILMAQNLDIQWGLTTTTTLLSETETGTVLSINGEAFFRNAILGLQAMAPQIFSFESGTVSNTDRTWSSAYATNISTQYAGTWVGTAQSAGASFFGKSYDLISIIIILAAVIAAIAANFWIAKSAWLGMIDGSVVAVLLSRAIYEPTYVAFIGGIMSLYVSAKVWGLLR